MSRGFYNGVSSMATYGQQLDNIAHNLANLNTTGFKRATTAVNSFKVPSTDGSERLEVVGRLDWSQGTLQRTGNAFDLGLLGDGFFTIESPEGEAYTRNGTFRIDETGVLQTHEGYPVAWEGAASAIDPVGPPVVVDGEGNVRQGDLEVGRLKLVDFGARDELWQDSQGYFHAPAFVQEQTFTAQVHQGVLETSTASGFNELVEMVQLQRSFQSMTRLLNGLQQGYERLTQPSR